MGEVEWTKEQVIRLMEEYKTMPELWDTHHDLYKVHTAKYEAFCRLAVSFQCDIADLRKKLYSIFASHRREKGKVRRGNTSTWFLYPYMTFLPGHIPNRDAPVDVSQKLKKAKKRPVPEEVEDEESEHSYEENDGDVAEEIIIKEEPAAEEVFKPQRKERPRLTRVVRRKLIKEQRNDNISTSRLLDTLKLLKKSDLMKKKDECDSFGEYIAVSLRKHDERTQSMIKQAINNILFEQEMKKYNSAQYTVVITGMEENPLLEHDREK